MGNFISGEDEESEMGSWPKYFVCLPAPPPSNIKWPNITLIFQCWRSNIKSFPHAYQSWNTSCKELQQNINSFNDHNNQDMSLIHTNILFWTVFEVQLNILAELKLLWILVYIQTENNCIIHNCMIHNLYTYIILT